MQDLSEVGGIYTFRNLIVLIQLTDKAQIELEWTSDVILEHSSREIAFTIWCKTFAEKPHYLRGFGHFKSQWADYTDIFRDGLSLQVVMTHEVTHLLDVTALLACLHAFGTAVINHD